MVQLRGIGFVAVFAPLMTVAILGVLKAVFGSLRVDEEDEIEGLDLSEHGESAYGSMGGIVMAPELGGGHGAASRTAVRREASQLT